MSCSSHSMAPRARMARTIFSYAAKPSSINAFNSAFLSAK